MRYEETAGLRDLTAGISCCYFFALLGSRFLYFGFIEQISQSGEAGFLVNGSMRWYNSCTEKREEMDEL